jgi:1,4-dihydroxy-2-naphthoate octaprenyltransferase
MEIALPVLFGVLIEAVVFYMDTFAVKKELNWRLVASLVIGISAAVTFQQDLFAAEFTSVVPYVGSVFTGIIFSRLANITNDVVDRVRGEQ